MNKIGIIDSGIGGLNILFDIYEKFPNNKYYYLGDSKNCPYGEKTTSQIKIYSYNLVKYLVDNFDIDTLIIACNSISCIATNYLKKNFNNLKIIEIIKPTIDYIKLDKKIKKIGLIATSATISSGVYQNYLKNYELYSKATPSFVKYVEDSNITKEIEYKIKLELEELIDKNIDTLILGCTHFPLLRNVISKFYNGKIITKSEGVLKKLSFLNDNKNFVSNNLEIYTTGNKDNFNKQVNAMFNKNINSKQAILNSGYYLELNNFEGPLDLLIHLIKENDVNIYDINISEVTNAYLEYITHMENLDITLASEYLVMAANLIELKSKSLLPRNEIEVEDEYTNERNELINKLVEYEKYKNIVPEFNTLRHKREEIHTKLPSSVTEYLDQNISYIDNMNMDILMDAMNKLLERKREEKPLNTKITTKELSVTEKCNKIRDMLKQKDNINFLDIFDCYSKPYVVLSFLSLLELVKSNEITIKQENNFNDIIICRKSEYSE